MRAVFAVFAAALALLLAVWTLAPSGPLGVDAPPQVFSAERAMRDIEATAAVPHPSGSAADLANIVYLAHRLAGMGLGVALDRAPLDDQARAKFRMWSGHDLPAAALATSIVALLPGRDPHAPAIVLMAHHDSVWASPGAADDGIGVATILEVARALKAGPPLRRTIVVLLTDAEELNLGGAKHFYAQPGISQAIGAVLNFEARGGGGRVAMFETGTGNGAMMALFAKAVPWPSANSLAVTVYRMMPNSTDLTPALKSGAFGFNFAITGDAWAYHSPLATPERFDRRSLQDMGQQGLGLARALATVPVLPERAPDMVFGDLWGSRLILYPAWGGWVLIAASLALGGWALGRSGVRGRDAAIGLVLPLALVVGSSIAVLLANTLSGAGSGANYYDRLAALPRLEMQAVLLCGAGGALLVAWRRPTVWGGWAGLFVVMAVLAVALQIALPAAATPIHWPLLIAAAEMGIAAWLDPRLERPHVLAPVALLAAAGGGMVLAMGHFLFLNVGAGLPVVLLVALVPLALMMWPLIAGLLSWRAAVPVAALACVAALAIALWVRLDPVAPSVPPYSDGKR